MNESVRANHRKQTASVISSLITNHRQKSVVHLFDEKMFFSSNYQKGGQARTIFI